MKKGSVLATLFFFVTREILFSDLDVIQIIRSMRTSFLSEVGGWLASENTGFSILTSY